MPKNVFVIGLDEFNLAQMQALPRAADCQFHKLLSYEEVKQADYYKIDDLLSRAQQQLDAFSGSIDAIVGYWDFPVSDMVPILCRRYGLTSASLESVLKCEHKYWSRLEQRRVIPECTPAFRVVDPFDEEALAKIDLDYPFWIKPVKSFASYLGYRINHAQDFADVIPIIRKNIGRVGDAFNYVLEHVSLPEEIRRVGGNQCVAEEMVTGLLCTLEGYVYQGRPEIYGIVDSIREPNRSTFSRYEYPSRLPAPIQQRMMEAAEKIITRIGFDNSAFNIEFFYNKQSDRVLLLEINPRLSQSHSALFQKVDGCSHYQIMIDLALGQKPSFPHQAGEYQCAAKFFIRWYRDAVVKAVPSEAEMEQIGRDIPGTEIQVKVQPGMRLSQLRNQESYSYEIADVFIGARDQQELLEKYHSCTEALQFDLDELEE